MVWFLGISGVVALGLLFWGFWSLKRKRLIENVPTSKVKGVFLGLNEVKGRAKKDEPLISYLAEAYCVYYRFDVAERWSRTVTYTDSKGNRRTRTESGWKSVMSHEERVPFQLEDSTGRLRVVPEGAEITADRVFSETCGTWDALYYGKGPEGSIANSDHKRRFTEYAIPMNAPIYVMGPARLREDKVEPEIAHQKGAELYLISTKDEQQITRGYGWGAGLKLFFGAAAAFAFPIGLQLERQDFEHAFRMQLPLCITVAGGYLGAVLVYYLTLVYNGLVSVRERAEMAWSMIDVQLRRRHNLIPRLVACVEGYTKHEQETQRSLAALRVEGARGGGVSEQSDLAARQGTALRQVFALAEAYPDLGADKNFGQLQDQLVDAEDRIALAREFYNGTIKAMNTRLESMPDALLKGLGRFKKGEFFAARGFERTPVKLRL